MSLGCRLRRVVTCWFHRGFAMSESEGPELSQRQRTVLSTIRLGFSCYGEAANAQTIAAMAGVRGNRRHGNGAVKGSWSGMTSPAFAVAPTLTSLVKRGLVSARWDWDARDGRGETVYWLAEGVRDERE